MTTSAHNNHAAPTPAAKSDPRPISIENVRDLLDELSWFYTRDWHNIVKDPTIALALIRRSTRAALYAEDIYADVMHGHPATHPHGDMLPRPTLAVLEPPPLTKPTTHPSPQPEEPDPLCVTSIPVSVDRVELFEFSAPHPHEHPLYKDHTVMHFCAAFYHEDEFIFARAHLQLLLTPTGTLNWLAGSRSVPIDKNYLPLPYMPGGELFTLLGLGITQLIYTNQTELKLRMKQSQRLPLDYKLVGMVLNNHFETGPRLPTVQGERQKPIWINNA